MSLTSHSVYIICHLHLILYTSYVNSFCIPTYDVYRMRCKWHDVYRVRCKWHMMYTEWGVSDIWYVTYTSFCIHHLSPHSVYIICHLILYTSYVTYTSFCIHHMSPHSVYMRCKWHMMYTEWGVRYDVYRMRCKWHMMYTEWGVIDIWCIHNEV
jgi:hypothetical protein